MTADDVKSILWLVPALPLIAALLNGFISLSFLRSKKKADLSGSQKMWRNLTGIIGITGILSAWIIAVLVLLFINGYKEHHLEVSNIYTWIPSGDFHITVGFYLDPLTSMMLVVVLTISLLVHIFSTGYMKNEDGFHRFYTYLPFFTFSMLGLVLVNNFLLLYVFWEAVGLSSYLLIGFWFGKKYDWGRMLPAEANKKAFVVNRIGDFGFSLGIMYLFVTMLQVPSEGAEALNIFDRLNYQHVFEIFENAGRNGISELTITLICVLLFMGAMGKSAQMPLNTWLPDAMAGPTPVSALIHAATMVTAGVYLVGRINPIIVNSPVAINIVAAIGIATAFFGATVGLTQKDIKAVMAYSTVSQLGYMFFALGTFGWVAAFFHLMTHAFFKGLLFLGCGAIIHSNEEAIHESLEKLEHNAERWANARYPNDPEKAREYAFELFEAGENAIEYGTDPESEDELYKRGLDPQSMDYMGDYFKKMPIVAVSMGLAAAALAGIPFTAGFFSKDEILGQTFARADSNPSLYAIYAIGLLAALFTAFYSFRMIFSVFGSKSFRMPAAMNKLAWAGMNAKAQELGIANFNPREVIDFVGDEQQVSDTRVLVHVPDPTWNMKGPLVFLGFMSIAAGYVGLPVALVGTDGNLIEKFLEPTFEPAIAKVPLAELSATTTVVLLVVSGLTAIIGAGIAYVMYHLRRDSLPVAAGRLSGPLYYVSRYKWFLDEFYNVAIVQPLYLFFRGVWAFDRIVIDGAVNGVARLTGFGSSQLRKVQTGFVSNYALIMAVGLILVVGIFYLIVGFRF